MLVAALTLAVPAIADAGCGWPIIEDFADNNSIDGTYTQTCYNDALASVPADFANYSNAIPAIRAAMARDAAPSEPEPDPVSEPVPAPATSAATPAKPNPKPAKKTKPRKRRNQSAVTTSAAAGATTSAPVVAIQTTPASTAAEARVRSSRSMPPDRVSRSTSSGRNGVTAASRSPSSGSEQPASSSPESESESRPAAVAATTSPVSGRLSVPHEIVTRGSGQAKLP